MVAKIIIAAVFFFNLGWVCNLGGHKPACNKFFVMSRKEVMGGKQWVAAGFDTVFIILL